MRIVKVYKDHGISGAKGRDKRPAFDALCRDATKRQFDVVMAWSVDRLGRSLQDLVAFLSELHALGIDLFLHQQGLDTTTPGGQGDVSDDGRVCRIRAAVSFWSASVLAWRGPRARENASAGRPSRQRWKSAIKAALAKPGRPGVRKIAEKFGVDPGTVQRISRPLEASATA